MGTVYRSLLHWVIIPKSRLFTCRQASGRSAAAPHLVCQSKHGADAHPDQYVSIRGRSFGGRLVVLWGWDALDCAGTCSLYRLRLRAYCRAGTQELPSGLHHNKTGLAGAGLTDPRQVLLYGADADLLFGRATSRRGSVGGPS